MIERFWAPLITPSILICGRCDAQALAAATIYADCSVKPAGAELQAVLVASLPAEAPLEHNFRYSSTRGLESLH